MTQPTALYLADVIANDPCSKAHHDAAAAELRRLYRVSEDLRESLNHKSYYQARLSKHMREMKVQHEELLEALKKIASIKDQMYGNDWEEIEEARVIARAAIAKAQQ